MLDLEKFQSQEKLLELFSFDSNASIEYLENFLNAYESLKTDSLREWQKKALSHTIPCKFLKDWFFKNF